MAKFSVAVLLAVCLFVCAQAFIPAGLPSRYGKSSLRMADDAPEVLTEASLREYLGKQGLRYNLNKTDKEIETEGDYNLFEKIFPTANNAARLALKKEARLKSGKPTAEQLKTAETWLEKYGYSRFWPAYMDKASEDPEDIAATEKAQKKSFVDSLSSKWKNLS